MRSTDNKFATWVRCNRSLALLPILLAVLIYTALSSIHLGAQGAYPDEVSHALPCFWFAKASQAIRDTPLLFSNHVSSIKAACYGIFMRLFGQGFHLVTWRILGLALFMLGLISWGFILGRRLPPFISLIFLLFLVTDSTMILSSRHDWGPTTVMFSLRLVLIAIWLRGELTGEVKKINSFWLGTLTGLSIYDNLGALSLLPPLAIMFLFSMARQRAWLHVIVFGFGVLLGSSPLLLANLQSWSINGTLVSLEYPSELKLYHSELSLTKLLYFFQNDFLALGNGAAWKSFILGVHDPLIFERIEAYALLFLLLLSTGMAIYHFRTNRAARCVVAMSLAYLCVGLLLKFYPKPTTITHWVLGTPFQYAALACGLELIRSKYENAWQRILPSLFYLGIVLWLLFRIVAVAHLAGHLHTDRCSQNFHPAINKLGQFAATTSNTVFICAAWGPGYSVKCLTQDKPGITYEPFWDYNGPTQIIDYLKRSNQKVAYVITATPYHAIFHAVTQRILADINNLSTNGWKEVAVEKELVALSPFAFRKFVSTDNANN